MTSTLTAPLTIRQVPSEDFFHGNRARFAAGRLGFLQQIAAEFGPVARYRIGCDHHYLISEPSLCSQALRDWDSLDNAEPGVIFLEASFLARSGRARSAPRAALRASLGAAQLEARQPAMLQAIAALEASWRPGARVELLESMLALGNELNWQLLLGCSAARGCGELSPLLCDFEVLAGTYTDDPSKRAKLDVRMRRRLYLGLEAAVGELLTRGAEAPGSVASALRELPLRARVHELCALLLSSASVGVLASFAWLALAHAPQAASEVRAELARTLGGRAPGPAELLRLPRLHAFLKETLRVYPPVALISRRALRDFHLAGLVLPAGSAVQISPYLLQRDPSFWPAPERFEPLRFEPGHPLHVTAAHEHFMPFGQGIRRCIGDHVALHQVSLILACLSQRFALEVEPVPLDVSPMGALHPRPLSLPAHVRALSTRGQA